MLILAATKDWNESLITNYIVMVLSML